MTLQVSSSDGIAVLTLDDAGRRNALSAELVEALHAAVAESWRDGTRLIVLRGNGPAFCAGLDLSAVRDESHGDILLRLVRIEELLQAIHHSRVPTVALGHGPCYGAGADLFSACTTRVAARDARFLFPGPQFGIVLGTRRLAALIGADRAWHVLSARQPLTADQALECGLVTRVLAAEDWAEALPGLRDRPGLQDDAATARILTALRPDHRGNDLADLVRSVSRPGFKSDLMAFVEKRK